MATTITANGRNLTSLYGLALKGVPKWRSVPTRVFTKVQVRGRAGALFTTPVSMPTRQLQLVGVMARGPAALLVSSQDALKSLLTSNLIRVKVDDGGSFVRVAEGYANPLDVEALGRSMSPVGTNWTIGLDCPTPYWREDDWSSAALSTTPVPLLLGTAPSPTLIRIMNATNPVLTYRDASGIPRGTMTFTITQAAGDYLEIDMLLFGKIRKSVSGTVTDARSTLSTSSDFPWAFDAQDGDYATAQLPTLELSTGTGVAYWQRYFL